MSTVNATSRTAVFPVVLEEFTKIRKDRELPKFVESKWSTPRK